MKVIFTTNIDAYNEKLYCFPLHFEIPPRKGDMVQVQETLIGYFEALKLPTRLEVTRVIWEQHRVICELWYNETDKKMADMAGAQTL